jgi:hypothetical protein
LKPNDQLVFVRDPAHTAAFQIARITMTPIGGTLSGCVGAIWIWVSGFVAWRFRHSWIDPGSRR